MKKEEIIKAFGGAFIIGAVLIGGMKTFQAAQTKFQSNEEEDQITFGDTAQSQEDKEFVERLKRAEYEDMVRRGRREPMVGNMPYSEWLYYQEAETRAEMNNEALKQRINQQIITGKPF